MTVLAALAPAIFGPDQELEDARESLAYWESRSRALPRHSIRRRREAREMTVRWQARVAEAERVAYGRGLVGALAWLPRREQERPWIRLGSATSSAASAAPAPAGTGAGLLRVRVHRGRRVSRARCVAPSLACACSTH